jgi:hypothetical protein
MGMNPGSFLHEVQGVLTGLGFKREIAGLDINSLRDADGTILTAATEPSREALETSFIGVVVSASQTDLGTLTFKIPQDYDKANDELKIRFLAQSAGDADTPTIDAALYQKRAGAALSADLDPTISDAVNDNSSEAGWVEVDCDDLDLQPGDAVTVVFTTSAHTTDALNIYALEVTYRSDLVFNDADER